MHLNSLLPTDLQCYVDLAKGRSLPEAVTIMLLKEPWAAKAWLDLVDEVRPSAIDKLGLELGLEYGLDTVEFPKLQDRIIPWNTYFGNIGKINCRIGWKNNYLGNFKNSSVMAVTACTIKPEWLS